MNKEQFRLLPFRKKAAFLWKKYSWQLVVGAFVVVLLGTWIHDDFIRIQPLLTIEMINGTVESGAEDSFRPFLEENGYADEAHQVKVNNRIQDADEEKAYRCDPAKLLLCTISEGKTDVYFWNSMDLQNTLINDTLMDLRDVLPAEVLEKHRDQLLYSASMLEGGYPCGIQLENNDWVQENRYYENCTVGIADTSKDIALAGAFLNYILK